MLNPTVNTSSEDRVFEINNNCIIADGLWYYDVLTSDGSILPEIYNQLLTNAREKVWIWDPYTNGDDYVLFENINREVDVRCLSYWGVDRSGTHPPTRKLFLDNLTRVQQNKKFGLEVRFYNIFRDSRKKHPFHDRYLFVDNQLYAVGASMGYHHGGNNQISSTAIHLVQSGRNKELIEQKFIECWTNSNTMEALALTGGAI